MVGPTQSRLHVAPFGAAATAVLTDLVASARAGDPFAPFTVVAPSATAGTTLRRRLAVGAGGLVNVRFVSLPQVAEQLAGPHLAGSHPAVPVSPMVARAHLRALLRAGTELVADPAVATSAATERALAATFAELAPLPEATLDLLAGTDRRTAALVGLFRRHREVTGAPVGTDHPATAAARLVASGAVDPAVLGSLVLHLPRRLAVGEAELVGALAERIEVHAVVGTTGDPSADTVAGELLTALAPHLGAPVIVGEAGAPPAPSTIVWAPDPAEEAATAVRRVVEALTGADDRPALRPERIAIVHRVRHPYAASLHSGLAAAGVPHHAPAVTTLAQSVPGRVLRAVVAVAADGFRHVDVSALWRAGPVLDPVTGRFVPVSWDAVAKEAGISGGVEQWHQRLRLAIEGREHFLRTRTAVSHGAPPDPGDDPTAAGTADWLIEQMEALDSHIAWLAEHLVPAGRTWAEWSAWLASLLGDLLHRSVAARQPDALDAVARIIEGIAALDGIEAPPDLERLRRVLEPELDRPGGSHGRFGHGVLVGRLVDVVGADLDLVIVLGASDGQFPPGRHEDPLLPDRVRDLAGGLLAPRSLRREEEHRDLLAALAAAPGRVLVGHRADPRLQRERQPAAWFTAACSARAGRPVVSSELASLHGEPWFHDIASFEADLHRPSGPAELDLADLLADHRHQRVIDGVVAAEHPELARGLQAATSRLRGSFDAFTGNVGAHPELVVGFERPQSATSLEAYATCPFRYLLRTVLRVGAIDDPTEADLISALDEGSLVHEVLERFIAGSLGKPPTEPWTHHDRARLRAVTEEVAGRYQAEGRTGRRLLWEVRLDHLHHQLDRVLDVDTELRAAGLSPAEVELRFGTDHDTLVEVTTSGGRTVTFKGSIDRVDRSADGARLAVYDYKTGNPTSFRKVKASIRDGDVTANGTKLQLPIYALAAKARHPGAHTVTAAYWFVGRKGSGEQVGALIDDAVEARFRDVMDVVVEGVEAGSFPANPGADSWSFGSWTHDNCSWCDYERVCPTTKGDTWVHLRTKPELRRYVELAEGPAPEDAPSEGGSS